MRVGLLFERKKDFPFSVAVPKDSPSELLAEFEEDELLAGLRDAGLDVVRIGDTRALVNRVGFWRRRCDIVFNRSVGYEGIERKLFAAAVLDAAGMPYVGSSPYALTLTRHKYHAKLVVADAGLLTPPAALLSGRGDAAALDGVAFPAIVKPLAESSSIGILGEGSVVASAAAALAWAERLIVGYRQPALVETFVRGAEVEVPLVVDPEPRALGAVAITLDNSPVEEGGFLASDAVFEDRYGFGDPPPYVDQARVMKAAELGAQVLGIRDYGRLDFRVARDGTPWFIEASTHPHIQRHSSFFFLARRSGQEYHAMLAGLVDIARRRVGLEAR